MQMVEEKKLQEAAKEEQKAFDPCRMKDPGDPQMVLPGLIGEDPGSKGRQQRQQEQLGRWLMQQRREQAAVRRRQKMEEEQYNQRREDMDEKFLQLQNIDMEKRKAAIVATKDFNLAQNKEKRHQSKDVDQGVDNMCLMKEAPSSYGRVPPQSLQQIIQFQKRQIEEKKRMEMEKKKEEERLERVRVDSARAALLMERQQARLNRQLRRDLDSTNLQLAQAQRQKLDIKRGHVQ